MKKTIIFISITILTLFIFLSFTIQQDKFVGTWINNKDQLWKITFTNEGHRKDYHEKHTTNFIAGFNKYDSEMSECKYYYC